MKSQNRQFSDQNFRIITEKTQKILYKNHKSLLQNQDKGAIISLYDSRISKRGARPSLSC